MILVHVRTALKSVSFLALAMAFAVWRTGHG